MRKVATVLLVVALAIALFNLPSMIGKLIYWRMQQVLNDQGSTAAKFSYVQWDDGDSQSVSGDIYYENDQSIYLKTTADLATEKVSSWIITDSGVWQYDATIPAAIWQGEDFSHSQLLQSYYFTFKHHLTGNDYQFIGMKREQGRLLLLLKFKEELATHYVSIDPTNFRIVKHVAVTPGKVSSCEWYDFSTAQLQEMAIALPVNVPLISIHELMTPQEDGIIRIPYNLLDLRREQEACNLGHQGWRLDPRRVAISFLKEMVGNEETFNIDDIKLSEGTQARVIVTDPQLAIEQIHLQQLVRKGVGGIWTVTGYKLRQSF